MTEDDLREVMRRLRANEISENYAFSRAIAFAQSELSTLKGENERLRGDIPDDAIYMRDVGNDEYDCWIPCINGDPGYVAFVPASHIAKVEAQRDELVEACGTNEQRAAKLEELIGWTGSAFLAGEKLAGHAQFRAKGDLYSFLCGLIGWFQPLHDTIDTTGAKT